ncbi:MAG TPA: alternative ribosome rescue aminoacyl-tRNA hydrolase ArfB [Actinomycetota bacterium]|jgi:ribosome-associated protein
MNGGVRINSHLVIPADEIKLTHTTSGGPGGQHANKAATRVELRWDVAGSRALGPRQRARILNGLRGRVDNSGVLRLSSDRHRSQLRNREDVTQRLATLVATALKPSKKRVATAPSHAARERRLQEKRRRGQLKRARRARPDDD